MMVGLFFSNSRKQLLFFMTTGASLLMILSGILTYIYLTDRAAGDVSTMLYTADTVWYAPFNIHYSVGVDGISVAMLILSSIIVFTGVFASW